MSYDLQNLLDRIAAGVRLSAAEYLDVYQRSDFHVLCGLAHAIRTRLHGDRTFYIKNVHINYTNICTAACSVCTFSRKPSDTDACTLTINEIAEIAAEGAREGVSEFHVVGGLNSSLPYSYYLDLVRTIRVQAPHAAIKAFTAVEIDLISHISAKPIIEVLLQLQSLGLDSLPGGGAEIFSAAYRKINFPRKISAQRWLEIHHLAHSLSIPTTATMLYNNAESAADRIDHLLQLRDCQDHSLANHKASFTCFVPLSARHANTKTASAVLDIRTVAISRIILDNIPHIKAFCPILGSDVARHALLCGADDFDNIVPHYRIVELDSAAPRSNINELITRLGLTAMQRDSFYNVVS